MIRYKSLLKEKTLPPINTDDFGSVSFYFNPPTIKNFFKGIRGLLDKQGNLYVWEEQRGTVVHLDAIRLLVEGGYLKVPKKVIPEDYSFLDGLLSYCCPVQETEAGEERGRFYLGESLSKRGSDKTQKFLDQAKKINPQYDFINVKVFEADN